jgi:hypothetical protein
MCVRRLLVDARDRAEIAGVYLADATYSERVNGAPRIVGDELQEALVAFALEAIGDGRPLVVTSSSHVPGGGGPSASETAAALRGVLASRGACFDIGDGAALAGLPEPAATWTAGSVLFADFAARVSHAAHVLTIAPVLLPRVVVG